MTEIDEMLAELPELDLPPTRIEQVRNEAHARLAQRSPPHWYEYALIAAISLLYLQWAVGAAAAILVG